MTDLPASIDDLLDAVIESAHEPAGSSPPTLDEAPGPAGGGPGPGGANEAAGDDVPGTGGPGAPARSSSDTGTVAPCTSHCLWCRSGLPRHRGPGRPRLYCTPSCRQRAYERRRGLGVLPPPEQLIASPGGPLSHLPGPWHAYETGASALYPRRKVHALRPAGIAGPGQRRATLCGVQRAPSGRAFVPSSSAAVCQTCSAIARQRPAARPLRPSTDLAAYRAQLDAMAVRLARAGDQAWDVASGMLFELLAAA